MILLKYVKENINSADKVLTGTNKLNCNAITCHQSNITIEQLT